MTAKAQRAIADWEFVVREDDVIRFADAVRHSKDLLPGSLPPTFPIVASSEHVRRFLYEVLKLDRRRVLHGSQSYQYRDRLRLGDRLRCRLHLVSDEMKHNRRGEALRVIVREIEMHRQPEDTLVLIETSTTIEKQLDGGADVS